MINVAIDGPVGAGKSTIAKECAKRLGFIYVDTGALYRTVGLYCKRNGIEISQENSGNIENAIKSGLKLEIKLENGTQLVFMNGENVSEEIRLPEVSMLASAVSAIPCVRSFLLDTQRKVAKENNVIMDGRDIGTVILPDAQVKIFITAKPEIRAKRRYDELIAKGIEAKFEDVLNDLNTRDYNDSHRAEAPLKQADDAILLDTSDFDFEQSVCAVINLIEKGN
ncbi:MAG: (d)CMP kinase [Ruminiclostridium sp.]|nr:(d)CMP kinase [Ruminiclostridium sp.]MBQ8841147.1 (d)CMP kinase [Ruminiclostridium sp.]